MHNWIRESLRAAVDSRVSAVQVADRRFIKSYWGCGDVGIILAAKHPARMKYFVYCRKSSEGEERQALSIPAQIDEIRRCFADAPDVEIVAWFEEKMSAKAPGRPIYSNMIARAEKGEAEGIIAWHPDRLARNSVDGGWIIHLLDRRVLKMLKFVSYTYEQSPEGMFMLQIMFGQSKYYVDNLRVNVKRGIRKKIEMGWSANRAPLGYRNDRETNTIAIDPERFPLLRNAWEMLLTGAYSVGQIRYRLNDEWGLRTPKRKKTGGGPVSLSGLHRLFKNPFYAGILDRYGEWRPAKHTPMITLEEYRRAQTIIGRPDRPKPETHSFAFTGGLIRCVCGLSVTAEEKIKPSGRRYVYYHCTRRWKNNRCMQPATRLQHIEGVITALLCSIQLPDHMERLLIQQLDRNNSEAHEQRQLEISSTARALAQTQQELRTLVDLRVRNMISDAEYLERRRTLQKEELQLQQAAAQSAPDHPLWLELGRSVILFRKYAADWFSRGTDEDKRLILQTVGSNCVLKDRKVSIEARFPFKPIEKNDGILHLCSIGEALGTLEEKKAEVQTIIEAVQCLQKRADARKERRSVPPLSPSLSRRRNVRRESSVRRVVAELRQDLGQSCRA